MRLRLLGPMLGLLIGMWTGAAWAKVPEAEAQQLRNRLTPLGAERAGNADGSIPEWRGGLTAAPACFRPGERYCDPFSGDQPYATINAANVEQWSERLSAGQLDLLLRFPETYYLRLFPSRRSFANPPAIYEAAFANARDAELVSGGKAVTNATLAVPFPIPKEAQDPLWNHRLRYQGPGFVRTFGQAIVTASGDASVAKLRAEGFFPYVTGMAKDRVPVYWLEMVLRPERVNDFLTLANETLDPQVTPRTGWRRVPDGRTIRQLRTFGYDTPAMFAEDLRFDDQIDAWMGGTDRYIWRLAGKRELIVPYNSYAIHSGRKDIYELVRPGHPDPRLARYELHRVWVVEANVRPGIVHRYKRRTFYLDEDSWQILMVDLYDGKDRLWRWQEVHTVMAYDRAVLMPAVEAYVDLLDGRYLIQGLDEGDPETVEKQFTADDFVPSKARTRSREVGARP